jgi:hypothetical protein
VTVPSTINGYPVTSIGGSAFIMCWTVTSVTIPDSVTNIGDGAFYDCESLTNLTIPASVTSIGRSAFYACTSLTSVSVPNGVTNIGDDTFDACLSLTSLTIPDTVTSIGNNACEDCTSLTNVTIGKNVISIGAGAFFSCSLTSVIIPSSVTNIGTEAFGYSTSLRAIYFRGNAPRADSTMLFGSHNATVYYLPGTAGWGYFSSNYGIRTVLWKPQVQISGASFGVQTNQFGFTIAWASGMTVVVEACTNLANPTWSPLATNILTGGSSYFSDSEWTNYPSRLYRLRSP